MPFDFPKNTEIKKRVSLIRFWSNFGKTLLISGLVVYSCFIFYSLDYPKRTENYFIVSKPKDNPMQSNTAEYPTTINDLLFGVVGSEKVWHDRKGYVEAWWRPNVTRGYLYLDVAPTGDHLPWSSSSPPYRVSDDLAELVKEINPAVPVLARVLHAIFEIWREEENESFRWLIMGDDDTVFFVDNLVDVLSEYDHTKYYYFGGVSESILSNFAISFNMGFGGAGFVLSYTLAKVFANNVEDCLKRYPHFVTGDMIEMSCIADIGVNLSPHKGFHQIDLHGDISGLLSSHPMTPFLSLPHFDAVEPIFPAMDRVQSIRHLMQAGNVDQSRLMQQTICYHNNWSISVSWGYSVHIYEAIIPRSWLQLPIQTFEPWIANPDPPFYMFNTRMPSDDPCEAPHVFYFESVDKLPDNFTLSSYRRSSSRELPPCVDGGNSAEFISHIHVHSPATKRIEVSPKLNI